MTSLAENRQPVPRAARAGLGVARRLALVLVAGLALTACEKKGEALVARAEQSIEEGRFRAAMIDLQNYLTKTPDDARVRARLAFVLTELNDFDRAESELKKARDLGAALDLTIVPECRLLVEDRKYDDVLKACKAEGDASPELDGTLTAIRGSAQFGLGQYTEARQSFERALTLNPNDVNALLGAAQAATKAGDSAAARQIFDRAPEGLRKQSAYWRALGFVELSSGNMEAAEKAYNTAIDRLDPKLDNDELLVTLGALTQVQVQLKKGKEAEESAQRMLKIAPDAPITQYCVGLAAEVQGDLERARTSLEGVAVQGAPQALIALARVNFKLGKYNQAEQSLKQVLAREPDNSQAKDLLDQVRRRFQSPEETLRQLEPQLETSPGDVSLAMRATELSLESGDEGSAREYLKLAETAAKTPEERLKVAGGYVGIGDFDRALALLESIPDEGGATTFRKDLIAAVALLKKGDRSGAIERANAMVAGSPSDQMRSAAGGIFAQAGDYPRAREQFTKVLASKPDDAATHFRLADVELRAGQFDAAVKQLQTVLQADPTNEQAALQMARVALMRRDAKDMERWVRKARDEHPKSAPAQLALAQLMLVQRKLDEARSAADAAVAIDPSNPKALTLLGVVQGEQGEHAASTATFRKLVDKWPRSIDHRLNLARAQFREGKNAAAMQTIDQAVALEPRNLKLLGSGVMFGLKSGDVERAAGYAHRVSEIEPNSAVALRLEARVAGAQKRYRDAVALLDRAAAKGPDTSLVGERFQYARLAKLPDAESKLLSWLDAHPEDWKLRLLLADHLNGKGDLDAARKQYETVLEKVPGEVVAKNNLAVIYQTQGDPRAAGLARSAYEGAPGNPMIADTYGWILVGQGDVGQGVEILRKAAANKSATPEVHYHLAAALARQGQRDEARRVVEELRTRRGPGYDAIRTEVEQLMAELGK
jgi:putative PEP-CTERM system TPR-repeat lipoprotein